MYPITTPFREYPNRHQKYSDGGFSDDLTLKKIKANSANIKNASYSKVNRPSNNSLDSTQSPTTESDIDNIQNSSKSAEKEELLSPTEDVNNASSESTATFDSPPSKHIVIRIDAVDDGNPSSSRVSFARNSSNKSSNSSGSSASSSSSCSSSSSSCLSSYSSSSSGSSTTTTTTASSETTYASFPDDNKIILRENQTSTYSVNKVPSSNNTLSNNNKYLTITPVQLPVVPPSDSSSPNQLQHSAPLSRSMLASPSSNMDIFHRHKHSQNNILSLDLPDLLEDNDDNNESSVSTQKFTFEFRNNPFRRSNNDPPKSISASTNTKTKINALAHKVEILQNKMNDMEMEWQRKEGMYRSKIASLNDNKESQEDDDDYVYSFDEETVIQKRNNDLEFAAHFYRSFCPIWLNEEWIRAMFLWVIIIWMLSNLLITIKILINYYNYSSTFIVIISIWKLYELSTIYIWLQIFFILSLTILSIYLKSKYVVANPKENTLLRIILMSIAAIVLLCNLFGTMFKTLSDEYWIKLMIGNDLQRIIRYLNYFIINVLSILIAILCIFLIIKRIYIGNKSITNPVLINGSWYNRHLVIKCLCSILFCDILIFLQSMYTFNNNFNNSFHINSSLEPLLTICIDSILIFLSSFIVHRTLIYQFIDAKIFINDDIDLNMNSMNELLLNEYKSITFYDSFQLILCLAPIADIITDLWTIYIYFTTPNEYVFGYIAAVILLISFRFHIALWLLLKRRNENFIFNSNYPLSILILCALCWVIPCMSLFTNCLINEASLILIILSITNEIILFFAPFYSPFIIIYQSAKDFIMQRILNGGYNYDVMDIKTMKTLNDICGDQQNELKLNPKQIEIVIIIRCLKRCGAAIPMFIFQTFVVFYHNHHHFNNSFRFTQYLISAASSISMMIQACSWYHKNK